jgi:hypothetical protein
MHGRLWASGRSRHPIALALGVMVVALLTLTFLSEPATAATRPRPRPDLAISAATFYHPRGGLAFTGEPARALRFCDRTTNIGRGATRRRLHNTLILRGADGVSRVVVQRDYPKLPGSPRVARGAPPRHFSHGGCATGEGILNVPPGAYVVRICADLKLEEVTHSNNCTRARNKLYVGKRIWSGTTSGNGIIDINFQPEAESWLATGLTYTFDPAKYRIGVFTYVVTAGNVSWKTAASANGCIKNGASVDAGPEGTLIVDYTAGTGAYSAVARHSTSFSYVVTNSCAPDDPESGPAHAVFLDSGIGAPPVSLPFGADRLAGSRTQGDGSVITWALQ